MRRVDAAPIAQAMTDSLRDLPPHRRTGIAMAEVLVAIALTGLSAGALLTAIASSLSTGDWLMRREIAQGLATQLLVETAARPLPDISDGTGGGYDGGYGGGSGGGATGREAFNTIDDYDGWTAQPPQTSCGYPLGADGFHDCGDHDSGGYGSQRQTQGDSTAALARYRRRITVVPIEPTETGWAAGTVDSRHRQVDIYVDYVDSDGNAHLLAHLHQVVSDADAN